MQAAPQALRTALARMKARIGRFWMGTGLRLPLDVASDSATAGTTRGQ